MPRTITDQEDAYYKRQDQIAQFVSSIYDDPALAAEAKALIKKKYPNLQIPDHDLRTELFAKLYQEKKERDDKERAEREKAEEERFKKTRTEIQEKYHFTDDAMKRLEDFMVERNIGDYDVAASYMASKEPKTSEPTWDSTRWHHDKQDGFAEIAKDPEAWARTEIMGAIGRDQDRARNGR